MCFRGREGRFSCNFEQKSLVYHCERYIVDDVIGNMKDGRCTTANVPQHSPSGNLNYVAPGATQKK